MYVCTELEAAKRALQIRIEEQTLAKELEAHKTEKIATALASCMQRREQVNEN